MCFSSKPGSRELKKITARLLTFKTSCRALIFCTYQGRMELEVESVFCSVKDSKSVRTMTLMTDSFRSFEHIDLTISSGSSSIRLVTIYRPPPSTENKLKVLDFLAEFSTLFEPLTFASNNLLLTGDLISTSMYLMIVMP